MVERDGKVRSFHVKAVNARTLRPILVTQIDRASFLMTDESTVYTKTGREFRGHGTVNHSIKEYVRGGFYIPTRSKTTSQSSSAASPATTSGFRPSTSSATSESSISGTTPAT